MAQLTDDCFAFGGPLMPVAEAQALLAERLAAVAEVEEVALAAALGRILREDVVAGLDVPPHDNAAVDGYAVFFEDLSPKGETRLPIGGRAAAGHPLDRAAQRGEAIRIFTGAPMPEGPDTVMMQEDCRLEGTSVVLKPGIKRGANRRKAGEDVTAGQRILATGRRLAAADLGLAASIGRSQLTVARPLSVALFSTGDEVVPPGQPLPPGKIYDANRTTIAALLTGLGCRVSDSGVLPDSRPAIAEALAAAAAQHDLIVTSGGVSEGEEDHVKAAVEGQGQLYLWRLAVKPGRPVAMGQVGHVPFVGLPGNPVACVVTFAVLLRPLVLRLLGAAVTPPRGFPVVAGFRHRKKKDRQEWLRVSLAPAAAGQLEARAFPREGAGILSSVVESEAFAVLAESVTEIAPGDLITVVPFHEVLA